MNPTGQPFQPPFSEPPPPGNRQDLNIPSILIIVMGSLGILFALFGLVRPSDNEQLSSLMNDPNFPPAAKQAMSAMVGGGAKAMNAFALLLDGLMVYGAVQMRSYKMFPLAMTSAVLAMLPCAGCCCLLGLPLGIWTITILMRPEVRSQFT